MRRLLSHILAAGLGLWLAVQFVPETQIRLRSDSSFFGIAITELWQLYLLLAIIVGLLNYFAKPILHVITLPLRILTLGLVGIIIDMALLWTVDAMFEELALPLWLPLLVATLIIWGLYMIFSLFTKKSDL